MYNPLVTVNRFITWCKTNKINILLFFLGTLILFSPPPRDHDFGWHLKYGEYLFTHGRLLRENIYSYTFPNYQWANSYWISEGIIYFFTFVFGSIYGPIALSLVLSAVGSFFIVYLLSKQIKQVPVKIISFFLLILFFSMSPITVRPMFFSFMFLMSLVYVLLYRKDLIKYLPLMFLLWANMHADFVLGLFIFGFFVFFKLVDVRDKKIKYDASLVYLILAALAVLVNPYFTHLHRALLKEMRPFQFGYIDEWKPLTYHTPHVQAYYAFAIALIFCVRKYRKRYDLWYLSAATFFAVITLFSAYFLRVVYIIGIFLIAYCLDEIWPDIHQKIKYFSTRRLRGISLSVGIAVSIAFVIAFIYKFHAAKDISLWSEEYYPYDAIVYIKENNLEGNLFNEYDWGGYIIWQLPEKKTFIDGRMPSWNQDGKSMFKDYIAIRDNIEVNHQLFDSYVDKYDIRIVLIRNIRVDIVNYLIENDWTVRLSGDNFYLLTR